MDRGLTVIQASLTDRIDEMREIIESIGVGGACAWISLVLFLTAKAYNQPSAEQHHEESTHCTH